MKTYRAAVIGCGRPSAGMSSNMEGFSIGYSHGDAYKNCPNMSIVAAADISVENALAFADTFNVKATYTNYQEMLEQEKPDIVSICTWPTLHKEMTINAVKAGVKMIWCEKPMAVGIDEIEEMMTVCEAHGARLFINHQRRYEYPFNSFREILDADALGDGVRMEAWVGDGWDLMSWGTHWVDMMRFLVHDQPVKSVIAQAPNNGKIRYGHPIEDRMLLQIHFENGLLGTIHLGDHTQGFGFRINGNKGTVGVDGGRLIVQHEENPQELRKQFFEDRPNPNAMHQALSDILRAYEQEECSRIDGETGARSTEVIMAAYLSAVTGQTVNLPLVDRSFNLSKGYVSK